MKRLFKRNTRKYDNHHNSFVVSYNAMKPQWLQEQRKGLHLSADEQNIHLNNQRGALEQLILANGLDTAQYLRLFPLPLLQESDLNLQLLPHEKELDDAFCREIGKIVPYLQNFTIQSVESYRRALDSAMLSIAKNSSRKDILDKLAAPYLATLLSKEYGLVKSYYETSLTHTHLNPQSSLLGNLDLIIRLMEDDGLRANIGSSITPPKQNNHPVGSYSTRFEDYVLRIDGIRMDSIEMHNNHALRNERRRQFVSGLDENLRILVVPPGYDCLWHSFKQAYFNGFTRLHPTVPLFGKKPNSKTSNDNQTNGKSKGKNNNKKSNNNNKKNDNKKNNSSSNNTTYQTPGFLKNNKSTGNSTNKKPSRNQKRRSQINTIATEVSEQRTLLQSLMDKLSLFDIPHATLTIVCFIAILSSTSAWNCPRTPSHYPSVFRQSTYDLSVTESLEISEMHKKCKPEDFHPSLRIGSYFVTDGSAFAKESHADETELKTCRPYITFLNKSNNDVFIARRHDTQFAPATFDLLLDIYAYHHAFNETCPQTGEEELSIPSGRCVPTTPIRKRKRPDAFDIASTPEMKDLRKDLDLKTSKITDLEAEVERLKQKASLATDALLRLQQAPTTVSLRITQLESALEESREQTSSAQSAFLSSQKMVEDLRKDITDLQEEQRRYRQLSEGSQNAMVTVQQSYTTEKNKLMKEHESRLATMRASHTDAIERLCDDLKLSCNKRIKEADLKNSASLTLQHNQDKEQYQKNLARVKNEYDRSKQAAIAEMQTVFDQQLAEVKNCLPAIPDIKMETDNAAHYVEKITEQARVISSLQQVLASHDTKPTTNTAPYDTTLCTSYNNFVTFLDHVKNLNVADAVSTLPSSIVSLLTFISTIVGTRLLAKHRERLQPQQYGPQLSTVTTTTNPIKSERSPLWTFGDGPVKHSINALLTEALPTLRLMVDGLPVHVLLDTGASINVIHQRIASKLASSLTARPVPEDVIASSANGSSISLTACVSLDITLGNEKIHIECYISPDINHDLIYGQPGLRMFGDFAIQWSTGTILLGNHRFPIDNTFPFRTTKEETLNPLSSSVINPSIMTQSFTDGTSVYAITNPYFKGSNRLVTYNTISPIYGDRINFLIDNHGNNPVALPKNTLLGYVTLIETVSDFEIRITNNGYSSDEADVCDRLPPYPSSSQAPLLDKDAFVKLVQEQPDILDTTQRGTFTNLLWTYRDVFYEFNATPGQYNGPEQLALKTIEHDLPRPIRAPRYTLEKEQEVAKQVEDMLNHDMIEPSRTPYLSRINLVKKNNEWRFVVDFRNINKLIQPQSHHIPRIDTIFDKAAGKAFYTSLDLKNGFHQLTLDKNSRYLTGFPTHMGIFQYKRIPMGLVGSPDFFNHVMEQVFSDTNNFVYLDDILLTDNSITEHLTNIEQALHKAHRFGLRFSLAKCLFFQSSLEYLGFLISGDGIRPNPTKTEALSKKPILRNEKKLRSFLGAANYYRKHIPSYSSIANILYDCTSNFLWTSRHTEAFEKLKQAIITACTLAPPNQNLPFTILTDASIQGIGAALMQENRPIAFASRTLKKAELMYAPVQLEALGLVFALKSFSPYIYGKRTTILTDQSSLLSLMTKNDVSNILDRYKTYIMGFDLDIKYIKGTDNIVADYLSRNIFNVELTSTTHIDAFPSVSSYLQLPYHIDAFTKYLNDKERLLYPNGKFSTRGKTRFYVPQILRFILLTRWHEHPLLGNHNGFDKGSAKFKEIFSWPSMDHDIKKSWSACTQCLHNKHHPTLAASVATKAIPLPPSPWHTLSLDHIVISENHYALVIMDEFSKFVIIRRTVNLGTLAVITILQEIIFLFGCPVILKSDNGPAFISSNFKSFCNTFDISHHQVSAYNHQGNGIVERFNRTIRESIRLYKQSTLDEILWTSQYAHNFGYLTTQNGKPKEFILNTPDRWLDDAYINNQLSGRQDLLLFMKQQLHPKKLPANDKEPNILKKGTIVYKRNPAAHKNDAQYDGPFVILENANARLLKVAPSIIQKQILPPPTETNSDISQEIVPTPPSHQKRGRPKKPTVTEDSLPLTNPIVKATRKRGRPKKKITTASNTVEKNTPRPRGRPKKVNN
ncbi:Reverse transcriptase domain and Integrase, catalytic core domain and Ribonuclease H-like domain and AT hook-like family and Aspartic peptidase domain-containing protein [Strongyloides ratti]|uniref:RNA-directed DNA polymerase n=1 Tax=Strongyloides ratti TaxID=34506 RepID=A0A090KVX4_STRRB|nr:Reverse transcriptase domain and Integrase, catalytic core domain and Ribonuclease H-like domain and AT hook-like family and Aspartic peptidase domain-containing protein [Strongyloides ratti]CEF61571.1 Reverse transcriptase domain and Integrase, catalytic core domain and Ribonuclease H-like domain and AT hook-like family and Aspartic peptidase domain-containing protein [Strongyloides ratti]